MAIIATPWTAQPSAHLAVSEGGDFELLGVLEPQHVIGRAAAHAEAIAEDLPARTHLEQLVQEDIAWHAAMRDHARAATRSALQAGELRRHTLARYAATQQPTAGAMDEHDARLVAAYTTPALSPIDELGTHHARQMRASIKSLLEIRAQHGESRFVEFFPDEAACRNYLTEWQRGRPWSCPTCKRTERCFLSTRDVFACRCDRQFSIRTGTLYARSKLPLRPWFTVVTHVVLSSEVNASQLARRLDIARKTTVRNMVTDVRAALQAADADQQLAGMPQTVLRYVRQARREEVLPPARAQEGDRPQPLPNKGLEPPYEA